MFRSRASFGVTRPNRLATIGVVRRLSSRFFLVVLSLLGLLRLAAAGSAPSAPVEVTSTKFTNVRPPNGALGNWYEASLILTVRPMPGSPAQMVSRVRVSLLLGFELPAAAGLERRIEYYRSEAECVALEPGRAEVRFYLPAELVKRDQIHADPKYFGIDLAVDGRPIPAGRAAYSSTLIGAEQRKNFQKRASVAAAANEGVLLPQYLTPFANEYGRTTPSFVRKDAR
jgi:hypothetical protein